MSEESCEKAYEEIKFTSKRLDWTSWSCKKCTKTIEHPNLNTIKNAIKRHIEDIHKGEY